MVARKKRAAKVAPPTVDELLMKQLKLAAGRLPGRVVIVCSWGLDYVHFTPGMSWAEVTGLLGNAKLLAERDYVRVSQKKDPS